LTSFISLVASMLFLHLVGVSLAEPFNPVSNVWYFEICDVDLRCVIDVPRCVDDSISFEIFVIFPCLNERFAVQEIVLSH